MPESNAPVGFEWKPVEMRRGAPVYPNKWREARFMTVDMYKATLSVLVPIGEPVVKKPVHLDSSAVE
jgi:hypothetical protein